MTKKITQSPAQPPKFSIIMIDYDQSVDRGYMQRAIQCLMVQTFTEFEIILLHDGPKETSYENELNKEQFEFIDKIIISDKRHNNWGHTLRNEGIRTATGEFIIHFNADNVLFPHALERLSYFANQDFPPIYDNQGNIKNDNSVLIFSIYMRGVVFCNGGYSRRVGEEDTYSTIMTGIPTRYGNIDCMQLVMKRKCWLSENGWYDKSRNSDGIMYPEFVSKYGARYIPELLGEHW